MDSKGGLVILIVVIGMFVCLIAGLGLYGSVQPQTINPSDGSILMVQPCGWIWCENHDVKIAEHVNKPNSEANKNNADANVSNAQATKIVSDVRIQETTQTEIGVTGFYSGLCCMGIFLLLVFVLYFVVGTKM